MHGAATTDFISGPLADGEAQQLQNLSHGHETSHVLKAHARHLVTIEKKTWFSVVLRNREEGPVTNCHWAIEDGNACVTVDNDMAPYTSMIGNFNCLKLNLSKSALRLVQDISSAEQLVEAAQLVWEKARSDRGEEGGLAPT